MSVGTVPRLPGQAVQQYRYAMAEGYVYRSTSQPTVFS